MINCENDCCLKMVKRSLKSAIESLEKMKGTARQEEVRKAVVAVGDMLAAYECVSVACLRTRAADVAKKIDGMAFTLEKQQKVALSMFISEMKAFIGE